MNSSGYIDFLRSRRISPRRDDGSIAMRLHSNRPARPCNKCENVAYLRRRIAIRHFLLSHRPRKYARCQRRNECVNLCLMRRVQIIFVLLALASSPLALVARSEACAEACTKSCCAAVHHASHDSAPAAGHCHSNRQGSSARCCDEPVSNHALDYGFTILMPLSILPDVPGIAAPANSGVAVVSNPLVVPSALGSAPFEPPRA